MASWGQHQAVLLGQVEVTSPMGDLDREERIRVAHTCHRAVTSGWQEHGWLTHIQSSNERVKVHLEEGAMKVLRGRRLVSRHKVIGVSVIAGVNGTSGHLVYIGKCQEQQRRQAVVLALGSEEKANQFIQEFQKMKKENGGGELASLNVCELTTTESRPPSRTYGGGTAGELQATETEGVNHRQEQRDLYPVTTDNLCPVTTDRTVREKIYEGIDDNVSGPSERSDDDDDASESGSSVYESLYSEIRDVLLPSDVVSSNTSLPSTRPSSPRIYNPVSPTSDGAYTSSSDGTEYEFQIENPYENLLTYVRYREEEEELRQQQASHPSLLALVSEFLRNEYEYLPTIQRISDAKRFLPHEMQHLLRGMEALADIHTDMYAELYDGHRSCCRIAQVFISRKNQLERYKYHLMNVPKINHCLENLPPSVKHMHPKLREDLSMCWRRLHYYFMMLEKIKEEAPEENKAIIQEAIDLLCGLYREGDSGILIDAVKGAPFDLHLRAPLLLQNTLSISSVALKRPGFYKYHVLLFAEMIVVTQPKNGKYDFKTNLRVEQLHFLDLKLNSNEFVLEEIRGGERRPEKYTFRARSRSIKDKWVQEISRLVQEFAEKSKSIIKKRYGLE